MIDNEIKLKSKQIEQLLGRYTKASNIINKFETDLLSLLELDSIGIKTIKNIAIQLNYTIDQQIEIDIKYYLNHDEKGNTCVKIQNLNNTLLQNPDITQKLIDKTMTNLKNKKIIIEYNEYIYDKILYDAECNIAKVLNKINNKDCVLNKYKDELIPELNKMQKLNKHQKLNDKQYESLINIFDNNINIIIGPAGTGKSNILKKLCMLISESEDISCLFLTPTGKACDNLTKSFTPFLISNAHFINLDKYPKIYAKSILKIYLTYHLSYQ